jgi:hypothetical protein
MRHDRAVLITALENAARTYRAKHPRPTLLGPDPDGSVLDPLAVAIASCAVYQAVAGHVIFSGGSGPVLESHSLAARLFSRGPRWDDDIPGAVDWLLRLLHHTQSHRPLQGRAMGPQPRSGGRADPCVAAYVLCGPPLTLLSPSTGRSGSMTIIWNAEFRILPPQPGRLEVDPVGRTT